ncbi:MAG: hypothetical protein CMD25_08890 [Flavobacteriales bacterium]|nr:hypothetical protein [Flavobacteriales bacterium]
MAKGNPARQKMINMMYLVLTALLALNVSKEVLNSFFQINVGIQRTTDNIEDKNSTTYLAFEQAAINDPVKFKETNEKVKDIKSKTDELFMFIQEMKYSLVNKADGIVYLGEYKNILDEDGKIDKEKAVSTKDEPKNFEDLTENQKKLPIAFLSQKGDRYASQEMFLPYYDKPGTDTSSLRAYELRSKIIEIGDYYTGLSNGNKDLKATIDEVCNVKKIKQDDGTTVSWQVYNFQNMPAVSALTILSKIQSDIRNVESDLINYLKRNLDSETIKFDGAQAIVIPETKYVTRGDSFRSDVFITAYNQNSNPDIFIGDYTFDSISGEYSMLGDHDTLRVVNGKGKYSIRTSSEGQKEWKGLINLADETGTKQYPFSSTYRVAPKSATISPVRMNILYSGLENSEVGGNPIKISVPGYRSDQLSISISNGTTRATNKAKGEYLAIPKQVAKGQAQSKATITVYATDDNGKRKVMGDMEFRVKRTPDPKPYISLDPQRTGFVDADELLATGIVMAELKDFDFDGIGWYVQKFTLRAENARGLSSSSKQENGMGFTAAQENLLRNAPVGSKVYITDISVKMQSKSGRTDTEERRLDRNTVIELELQ